ncbi:hypothetical protein BaRGS_00007149 [Batillaria attramentaria]|uniref:Fork-head domain-containing protein n=1 Tax=Batillaria attramentaria TaxID=370345 RepID=A0ABD0LRE6_9CAEN|nr:hypothetical protein BaRGS_029962 [Batillaria attramentaria]
MCTPNHNSLLSYGLKVPAPAPYFPLNPAASQLSALDLHRSQLCEYNARVQLSLRGYTHALASLSPYHGAYLADPYTQYLYKGDPRARFVQEEPKPSHSYIGLIAMAILSSKEKKLVLSDIYQWILDNYPYFRTRGPGWRNSIRHNLSLNDCFIKAGRSANGKGHYWAVHPANVDDFTRGDFRRRRAQRKVRKHMGLSVPDDDDDSPSPSPNPISWVHNSQDTAKDSNENDNNVGYTERDESGAGGSDDVDVKVSVEPGSPGCDVARQVQSPGRGFVPLSGCSAGTPHVSKKRLFDVESLLAPDFPVVVVPKVRLLPSAVPSSNRPVLVKQDTISDKADQPSVDHHDSDDSDVDIENEDESSCENDDSKGLNLDRPNTDRASDEGEGPEDEVSMTMEDLSAKSDVSSRSEDAGDVSRPITVTQSSGHTPDARLMPIPSSSSVCMSTSSVLDLSSSSPASSLMAMTKTPFVRGKELTMLPQSMLMAKGPDGQRNARWTSTGMELGLGRYSAFHAASGGLRGPLPSVVPFLHPVLAASRYPSILPPGATSPATGNVDSILRTCNDEMP